MIPRGCVEVGADVRVEGPLRTAIASYAPQFSEVEFAKVLAKGLGVVVGVSDSVVVKFGKDVSEAEAESMRFVAKETTVPVPKLFGVHKEGGYTYIVMEYIDGVSLKSVWGSLDSSTKDALVEELKEYVDQLRNHTASYIGMVGRRPCCDPIFQTAFKGPFDTESQMNEEILKAFESSYPNYLGFFVRKMLRTDHMTVFSHGDIRVNNILVKDGRVRAIIDWEMSGFYPEYWDFSKALWGIDWRDSDWGVYVQKFLKPYYDEFAISLIIRDIVW